MDAPLDDANVDRFIRMLRRFSDRPSSSSSPTTSGPWRRRDCLYGVTMEELGVSKLVSVRFDGQRDGDGEPAAEATDEARAPEAGIGPAAERTRRRPRRR